MKHLRSVKVEIGLEGNRLNLDLPHSDYVALSNKIKTQKTGWITVGLSKNSHVDIKADAVQYIKMRPPEVKELTKRDGYTLKEICAVMGVNYDVFRQKIKKEGIDIDISDAGRRVLLTPLTIKSLGLTAAQISKIKNNE